MLRVSVRCVYPQLWSYLCPAGAAGVTILAPAFNPFLGMRKVESKTLLERLRDATERSGIPLSICS